jgi:hypothetical protein
MPLLSIFLESSLPTSWKSFSRFIDVEEALMVSDFETGTSELLDSDDEEELRIEALDELKNRFLELSQMDFPEGFKGMRFPLTVYRVISSRDTNSIRNEAEFNTHWTVNPELVTDKSFLNSIGVNDREGDATVYVLILTVDIPDINWSQTLARRVYNEHEQELSLNTTADTSGIKAVKLVDFDPKKY